MDKRRTIIGVLLTLLLVSGWMWYTAHLREKYPDYGKVDPATQPQPQAPAATTPAAGAASDPSTHPTTLAATGPSMQAAPAGLAVQPAADGGARPATLGPRAETKDDPEWAMRVTLSPVGAGIEGVTLTSFRRGEDFKKLHKDRQVYTFQHPDPARPNATRPLATATVYVDDRPVPVGDAAWTLASEGAGEREVVSPGQPNNRVKLQGPQAVYTAVVTEGGQPKVELTKTFTLFRRSAATLGYELGVDLSAKNLSGVPTTVRVATVGPALPPGEAARPPDRQIMAGYTDPRYGSVTYRALTLDYLTAEEPTKDLTRGDENHPVAWAGFASVYFDAFVLFDRPDQVAKVSVRGENFERKDAEHRPAHMAFESAALKLQPGETATLPTTAHFGPRWRDVLKTAHYQAAPRQYDLTLIITSGICAICTFGWLINVLVWLLNGFHYLAGGFAGAGDWGIAIILLVALVRTLLHPITKRSQVQMMKMAKMGPEIQRLKDKHGDDKEAYARAQAELMREHVPGQLLGCAPMFLQMPIWIALWQALQSTFELRQAPFLWGATWIRDLSKPDYLIKFDTFSFTLPFNILTVDGLNLLPILMSVIFYVQVSIQNSLQPKGTPEQETQKKMMKWMSVFLFPLFLYSGPSGLNLYILTSTLIGIIESKVIRDHIKQREAAEAAAGPVVVDARPTRAARKGGQALPGPAGPPKKPSRLAAFMEKLNQQVEDMKREQDRRGGKAK